MSSAALKLVSLNVRGVSNLKKKTHHFHKVSQKECRRDFFLQETHSNKATENQWQREWGGRMLSSRGSPNSCGTSILINNKANCTVLCSVSDPLGCFISSKVQVDDKVYVLVNFMYQTKIETRFISLRNYILCFKLSENLDSEENIIVGGDFNCPLNPTLDKIGGIMISRKSAVNSIERLQSELDLVDI